jgi:hypothetical protein
MSLAVNVFFYSMMAAFAVMLRGAWHFGTYLRLENQATLREHELRKLRLQIELERERHSDPDQSAPPADGDTETTALSSMTTDSQPTTLEETCDTAAQS